jgi:hypothetical protein
MSSRPGRVGARRTDPVESSHAPGAFGYTASLTKGGAAGRQGFVHTLLDALGRGILRPSQVPQRPW